MPPKGSSPGKNQKKRAASKKLKKALVACPTSDTDEESQSLLVTQPQGTEQQRLLAGAQSDEEDGHGGEGEEASQTSSSKQAKHKRATPTATITSGQTLSDYEAQEGQEEGPPPPKKLSSVFDSLTVEQEQRLVDFFAANPIFYDQTKKEFKDKGKRDHLLGDIGDKIGITGKCTFLSKHELFFNIFMYYKH